LLFYATFYGKEQLNELNFNNMSVSGIFIATCHVYFGLNKRLLGLGLLAFIK